MQGIKFSSYVENVRISRAKELLEDTGLSVKEIAEQIDTLPNCSAGRFESDRHEYHEFRQKVIFIPENSAKKLNNPQKNGREQER